MGHEDLRQMLSQLRTAVRSGAPAPMALELIDRIEAAVGRMSSEADGLRSRLERPLTSSPAHHSPEEAARLEEWVRRLEQPGTTAQ